MNEHQRRIRIMAALVVVSTLVVWRLFFMERTVTPPMHSQPVPTAQTAQQIPPGATPAGPVAPPPAPTARADLILDLFNPSQEALSNQLSQSEFARQMEEAMVIAFLLRRCELVSETDYAQTYRDFLTYTQRVGMAADIAGAAARMQPIVSAASASYAMLYGRMPCGDPAIAAAHAQLNAWRRSLARP